MNVFLLRFWSMSILSKKNSHKSVYSYWLIRPENDYNRLELAIHEWNIQIILQQFWPEIQSAGYFPTLKDNYYSLKIFPRSWLVKTTHIIHHNQLLFTKFGKNLRKIESMTSKVQYAADYWTVDRENVGTRLLILVSRKTKSEWQNSLEQENILNE